ncbi:WD40-repeat-containing domain protein [Trichoderma evansii]
MALENLDTVLESIRLLWERNKNDADLKELRQRAEDGKSRLRHIEEEREMIESEFKRLEVKKKALIEEEEIKIQEIQGLEKKQGDIRKGQKEIPEQVVYAQKRLKEYYHTKGCENGWTPLRSAMEIGDVDMMDMLFDEITDIMAEDKRWSRWITASRKGSVDEIRSLIATDETEIEHKDGIFGRTPLSWASVNGHRDVVKLLLDTNKVDFHSKDNHGRTPLRWASEKGYYNIVQLMLQRDKPDSLRQIRNFDQLCSLAFSHDSKLIAAGSEDMTFKLWDSTTSECLRTFQGHTDFVLSVAFSHDSKLVLSGSSDYTIKLWDSTTGECLQTFQGHRGPINSIIFSHDSKLVASGSGDGTIKLWASTTGECLHTFIDHKESVLSVAFSHDSKLVASGSYDGHVKLWASTTGECLCTLKCSGYNTSVAFSQDSKLIVVKGVDRILLWDISIVHDFVTIWVY